MPGAARPRYAQDIFGTCLPRAGQRGAGAEQGFMTCPGRGAALFTLLRRAGTQAASRVLWAPAQQRTATRYAASGARNLSVLVHRLALLDERRHAFGTIFQRESRVEQVALDVHAFRQ